MLQVFSGPAAAPAPFRACAHPARADKIRTVLTETGTPFDASARFAPGTLRERIVARAARARRHGALRPIETEARFIDDHGIRFQVRAVSSLTRRPDVKTGAGNPFLPYEEDLYVAGVSSRHVCLLNKYPVIDHHVLIVTRAFEPQESPLNAGDFEALWRGMAEYEALGFYNSGAIAGASQEHKHLQLVPLPLTPAGPALPVEPWLDAVPREARPTKVRELTFRHAFAWLDPDLPDSAEDRAAYTHDLYVTMLARTGLDPGAPGPYNLLVTRRFLLLVPRAHERFQGVAVNALGFAGSFFVPTARGLEVISRAGPLSVLRHVALPA